MLVARAGSQMRRCIVYVVGGWFGAVFGVPELLRSQCEGNKAYTLSTQRQSGWGCSGWMREGRDACEGTRDWRAQYLHPSTDADMQTSCPLQAIRKALLVDSSSSSSWTAQQRQADALAEYNGGPLLFVSDPAASDDAAVNIQMPAAPLLYGYSVGLCLGSGLSEPGGAGLGTLGFSEVS